MSGRLRGFDWQSHPLGASENWCQEMLASLPLCLNSGSPTAIYWGSDLRVLYNDAWSRVFQDRHPGAFGQPAREIWKDIWSIFGTQLESVLVDAVGLSMSDQMLPIQRGGETLETFWNYSLTPIMSDQGKVLGVFNQIFETTDLVLAVRARAAETEGLRETFEQAPGAIAILKGPKHRFEIANAAYIELIGGRSALIGRTVSEVLPEVVHQGFLALLDDVYRTGKPYIGRSMPVDLMRFGVHETRLLDFIYQPTRNASGDVDGIFVQATDVTERERAEKKLSRNAAQRVFLDDLQRDTQLLLDADAVLARTMLISGKHLNASVCAYADMDSDQDGFCIRGAWTAPGSQSIVGRYRLSDFGELAVRKLRGGEALVITDNRIELPAEEAASFQALGITATVCIPLIKDGHLKALMAVHHNAPHIWDKEEIALIREITERSWAHVERVSAEQEVRESEQRYQALFDLIDEGFCIIEFIDGPRGRFDDYVHVAANAAYVDNTGIPNVVGQRVREMVPDEAEGWVDLYRSVLETGHPIRFEKELEATGRWLELAGFRVEPPTRNQVAVLFKDITARKRAEDAMRLSEERLRLATEAAHIGTWDFDPASGELKWDTRCKALFGLPEDAEISYEHSFLAGLHPDDRDRANAAVQAAITPNGSPFYDIEYRTIGLQDGIERWISAKGSTIFEGGKAVRFIGTVLDITAKKRAERRFELVNRIGVAVAAERDIDRIVQQITDAGVELTGAEFGAFFYNKSDDNGESLTLYKLSGAPREQFEQFPMPRNTELFAPTFAGESTMRFDDVREDHRYGKNAPYKGMPEGHLPVVSYLSVPVISHSGEVLGGLFFGHKEKGVFREEHEVLLSGLAGQAATAIDNSRLIAQLQTLNATLEQRVNDEVAERTRAEEQLRQAQKMEAIGQLTGGIAHDFNNLLAGISGSIELTQTRISQGRVGDVDRYLLAAQGAAKRAAALTHRLLAFSRRQTLDPKPTNLNKLIDGMEDLIRRTMGPDILVESVAKGGLWSTFADQHQLENALLNLCINARDAMPNGGKLTIETSNRWLDDRAAKERELDPGQYVSMCVSDNGCGMAPDVIKKAFDPFFTTKPIGVGTGLGLSMVYGFARQSGGQVRIYSELGQGTMVCIYLPRHHLDDKMVETVVDASTPAQAVSGETVLVVEDEPLVRMLVVDVLEELGYSVIEASDGPEAVKVFQSDERIDLLITDVGLPNGMNGRQVADAARQYRPDLKVLFATGYAENAVLSHGHLDRGMHVITKPFVMDILASKVRNIIEGV